MDLRPRTLIQRLTDAVHPTEPEAEPDAGPDADPDGDDAAPVPDPAATATPAPPVIRASPLPDWRTPKPPLEDIHPVGEGTVLAKAGDDVDGSEDQADEARRDYGGYDGYEGYDEADGDTEDQEEDEPRRRWSPRGSGKQYLRPGYRDSMPAPKESIIGWWLGMSAQTRWGLYNGTALAGGFALGVPQFFTAQTAYLATTYDSWTHPVVCIWYGVATGVWMLDHRTRRWFPPFALATRMPLISMIAGVLLYGRTGFPA